MGICLVNAGHNVKKRSSKESVHVKEQGEFIPSMVSKNSKQVDDLYLIAKNPLG